MPVQKLDLICAYCGVHFKRFPSALHSDIHYCSTPCANRAISLRQSGTGVVGADLNEQFAMFYKDHERQMFGYAFKKVRDYTLATELISRAYFKVLTNYKEKFNSIYQLKCILYRAIDTLYLDTIRDRKKTPIKYYAETPDLADVERTYIENRVIEALYEEINNLPETHKAIMLLTIDGKNTLDIAEALGKSQQNILNTKQRIFRNLRSSPLKNIINESL